MFAFQACACTFLKHHRTNFQSALEEEQQNSEKTLVDHCYVEVHELKEQSMIILAGDCNTS